MGPTLKTGEVCPDAKVEPAGDSPQTAVSTTAEKLPQVLESLPQFESPKPNSCTELIVGPETGLMKLPERALAVRTQPGGVLSPTQVRTFLDCQARWWFKYVLQLPDTKSSSLALGLAIHRALELNFREKLETHEDLDTAGVVMLFRDAWMEQAGQTQFGQDESQQDIRRMGEHLVAKYMDEVAPTIDPVAVEMDVQGDIEGVPVRGRVDLLDRDGRLIDIKTAARRPSYVSSDYAFQLATYRQITPGATGEARIDSLVKTAKPAIVQQSYRVAEADLHATRVLFPLVREAMSAGVYCPNRQSILCSQKYCGFWRHCEGQFGGKVRAAA